MSDIVNHSNPGTSFITAVPVPSGSTMIEVWGVADISASVPTYEDCYFKLIDQEGDGAPMKITAGNHWEAEFNRGDLASWTYSVAGSAASTDIVLVFR